MKGDEIHIRDPYVLPYEGKYYLYGTRSATCWGQVDGLDCYVSEDLKIPTGEPYKLFSAAEASWANPVPFAKAEFGMDGDVSIL